MEEYTIIAYLKGELDSDASQRVETWICLSDENRKIAENIYVLLFVDERIRAKNEIDTGKAFDEFRKKNSSFSTTRKTTKTIAWQKISAIAAIFIIGILSATLLSLVFLENSAEPMIVSTKLGERAHVTLPDGSSVWLNACSRLEYKKSILSRKRKATLDGEAYFEITRNRALPFVVAHDKSQIKVLGTKFNVRCNNDEAYLKTTLLEGAVHFSNKKSKVSVTLKPGEELLFDQFEGRTTLTTLTTPKEIIGWIDGKLLFENISLEEIAKSLERNYNVRIHFADEDVKQKRFNAEFEVADNIYQILSILELTNTFTYQIDNREITIFSKK